MSSEINTNQYNLRYPLVSEIGPVNKKQQQLFLFSECFGSSTTEIKPAFPSVPPLKGKEDIQRLYPELSYTKSGDIDFSAYTLEKLRKRYPPSKYNIKVESNTICKAITVTDKKTNEFVFSYSKSVISEKVFEVVSFIKDGINTNLTYMDDKFWARGVSSDNGNHIMEYYDNSYNIYRIQHQEAGSHRVYTSFYANGKIYKKNIIDNIPGVGCAVVEMQNIIADKLEKYFNSPFSQIGFSINTKTIEDCILKDISSENIIEVLNDYRYKTGKYLMQDIVDNKLGLSIDTQKKLLNHLTNTIAEFEKNNTNNIAIYHDDNLGCAIGYQMRIALQSKDKTYLKQVLKNVNKDNVSDVLKTIFKINVSKYEDFSDFSQNLYPKLYTLLKDEPSLLENLICIMLDNIKSKGGYCDDINADLKAHRGDYHKTCVDFTRLLNRCHAGQISEIEGVPDGKIDTKNIRQGNIGDCWLLGAIISITNKSKKGLNYMNSLLSVDAQGNVTVYLKGVNKKYKITAKEIKQSNHLSCGDPDIRAIEIAVDKYMKEKAYEDKGDLSSSDIEGDRMELAYKLFFGNGSRSRQFNLSKYNFNSEDKVYSIAFHSDKNIIANVMGGKDGDSEQVQLKKRHAYAIKGSDKDYLYLINPWDSSKTLKVSRAELRKTTCHVASGKIPE